MAKGALADLPVGAAQLAVRTEGEAHFSTDFVAITPRNPKASPVTFEAWEHQIDLHVGPDGNLHEIWNRDPSSRLVELERCLKAIVQGRYEERVRTGRLEMVFDRDGDPLVVTHVGGIDYGPHMTRRFEPYR